MVEQTPKTIRVRIAVAIAPDGNWNSAGWSGGDDKEKMDLAVDPVPAGEARYWVEAELPVPTVNTVAGSVAAA